MEGPASMSKSRTIKFHKLFKSVPEHEYPVDYFSCAYIGDILLQGNLYVSQNWFCFYSRIRGRGRLLEIPMDSVISITREKTAIIFPNAIGLQTKNDKYAFGSFISRDSTYKFLVSMWKKSQEAKSSDGACDTIQAVRSSSSFAQDGLYGTRGNNYEAGVTNGDLDSNLQSNSQSKTDSSDDTDSTGSICIDGGSIEVSDINEEEDVDADISLKTDSNSSPAHPPLGMRTVRLQKKSTSREKSSGHTRKKHTRGKGLQFPYSVIHYIDKRKTVEAIQKSATKLQKIPRTSLLLAVCTFLVLFLIVSAFGLTYKILDLEARISAGIVWSDYDRQSASEKAYMNILGLHSTVQESAVQHVQSIMRANLKVLEEINSNLRELKSTNDRLHSREEC